VFIASVVLAMLGGTAYSGIIGATGPWLAEWFANRNFEDGPVLRRYVRKIEFNWGRQAPVHALPKDEWSAVFTTCLGLDIDETIDFQLRSDDGARLDIDGKRVVDNWGPHASRTRTGTVPLTAGTHTLRLEYFDAAFQAELQLFAKFPNDENYTSIPVTHLTAPRDGAEPCG